MKSPLLRNVLTLMTGNTTAFIIPVLFYPVLSRIFSADDYALFGLYIAIFSVLEIGSAGRYDQAVLIPEKDDDSLSLIAGGLILSLVYAALILLIIALFGNEVSHALKNHMLSDWLFVLPVALVLISVSKLFNAWLIRRQKFNAASVNKASQKIAEVGAQLGFGLTSGNGLILGDLAGRLFNAGFSIYQGVHHGFGLVNIDSARIKASLVRYASFPKYNVAPSMLNALAGMTPIFVVSYYFSTEESGSFNFSRLMLSVPAALISSAVSQVVMQAVSQKRHNKERCSSEIYSLGRKLFVISGLGMIPVLFFGPELFGFVFGEKWIQAGEFTTVLVISYAISFVVSPFSSVMIVLERIKWVSAWQIIYFLIVSVLWFVGNLEMEKFLVVLVSIDVIAYILYGLLIVKAINRYENGLVVTRK